MASQAKTLTFPRGGVHPDDQKARTRAMPLEVADVPAEVAVLMVQHIGAPAASVVKKRDSVKKGQLVGESQGFISANVHAPVSGTIRAVEPRTHCVTGMRLPAVVIENDGEEDWADGLNEPQDVEGMDSARMIE
ncbi:MAG: hypothetical protein ACYTFZ_11595, partial [Planctomycetota bacterium]